MTGGQSYKHLVIKFFADRVECQEQGFPSGVPQYRAQEESIEVERSVARIFHKLLNWQRDTTRRISGAGPDIFVSKDDFVALGKTLYKLFGGKVVDPFFMRVYGEMKNNERRVSRLYLEFDDSAAELAALPWEYLFYARDKQGDFISALPAGRFHLIRSLPAAGEELPPAEPEPLLPAREPLNLLLIISKPDGEWRFETAEIEKFFTNFQQQHAQRLQLHIIKQPGRQGIRQQFQELARQGFVPDIIHFIGHGEVVDTQGKIAMVRMDESEGYEQAHPDWMWDYEFANLLDVFPPQPRRPYLFFLQACRGGTIGDFRQAKGAALQLLYKGVHAVVAMQNPVRSDIADFFARHFYESLLQGDDVATAVTRGRIELALNLRNSIDQYVYDQYGHKSFGSPVLFTDTYRRLMLFPQPEAEVETPPEAPQPEPMRGAGRGLPGSRPVTTSAPSRSTSAAEGPSRSSTSSSDRHAD